MIKKETYLSGHMYRGSAYETDNICGNCDGAKCENCEKVTSYKVVIAVNTESHIEYHELYSTSDESNANMINSNLYRIKINGSYQMSDIRNIICVGENEIFAEKTEGCITTIIVYMDTISVNQLILKHPGSIFEFSKIIL